MQRYEKHREKELSDGEFMKFYKVFQLLLVRSEEKTYLCNSFSSSSLKNFLKPMKRKEFKKRISLLCGELMAECIAAAQFGNKASPEDVENVALSIITMQDDLICRLSHVEPGSTKLFFKKLREDMQKRTEEIVGQIQNL